MTHTPEPAFRSLDHISSNAQDTSKLAALSARIAELEAQLYAVGAGGVGQSIKPKVQADTAQEPVAWRVRPFDYGIGYEGVDALTTRKEQCEIWARKGWRVEPLYAAPKPPAQSCCTCTKTAYLHKAHEPAPQQKPVAWMYDVDDEDEPRLHFYEPLPASNVKRATPLYTAPKPTRQPLTDEKLYALYCEAMKGYYVSALHYWRETEAHKFARAIEAAVANQPHRQPLTDEQIMDIWYRVAGTRFGYVPFARAIESAHGITGGQQ